MFRKSIGLSALLAVGLAASLASAQTRPHNFDLLDVRWSVALDEPNASLVGDVTNTLRPDAGATSIKLDFGSLPIDSITVDGAEAHFTHAGQTLTIELPAAASGDKSIAVRVRYHGKPKAGAYFIPAARAYPAHTPVVYTQGEMVDNRFWLPTYDYPDDKATSEGTIDVPDGWFALSNGKLLDKTSHGGRTQYHWKMDQPHATYLISFVAGPYEEGKESWDGIPVSYWVPNGLLDQGKTAFGGTADIVKVYSQLTGVRYPWVKYAQSAVPDFMFGGMENVTCTTQTITALHPQSIEPLQNSVGLAAHELAHQWFGDYITCNGWSDAWINEGWATFMPPFFTRASKGEEAFDIERYDIFQGGLAAHAMDPGRPVVWKGYKDALDMFNNFIYPGGASRMFMLMHQVGEPKFWKATGAYLNERKYTSFDTKAFFETYSKNLGTDLTPFMNQWFFTAGCPNLSVSMNGSNLVVKQSKPLFHLDVPVWVYSGGTWIKKKIKIDNEKETLDLGASAGKAVLLDPECWLMANISYDIPTSSEDRMALFLAAPNAASQCRIMDTMLGDLKPEERLALARRIKSPRILERYINHLGANAVGYLLELTKNADRRVANAAVGKLGQFNKSDVTDARLREIADNDPNDLLRQHALRELLNFTNDAAMAEKAWRTEGYDDGYRRIALDWWTEKRPDLARERCLEAIHDALPEPTRVDAIGHLGQLKDKGNSREVFDALARILTEQSFGARIAAISSLASYGDRAAIPLIEPYENAELVFFRMSAGGALAGLRQK